MQPNTHTHRINLKHTHTNQSVYMSCCCDVYAQIHHYADDEDSMQVLMHRSMCYRPTNVIATAAVLTLNTGWAKKTGPV